MSKQNVNALREKLVKAQANSNPKPMISNSNLGGPNFASRGSKTEIIGELEKDGIKDHELRALNYIVMKFLLTQGYKVSAITFEEEVNGNVFILTDC
jgi:hypothetical protein